ncbi:unnamed protein product [Arabis nemorensis]|uniref:Uncharacterized protein n=1 Tax=Arabis nemorensis TaxID=586526 RepID=A0A565CP42_9BRAS|nr:unnamed protein product [Arabis nemorensis]
MASLDASPWRRSTFWIHDSNWFSRGVREWDVCESGGSDGGEDETEEKDGFRQLMAEERYDGDKYRAWFAYERRVRRRRVADIVLPAAKLEVDVLASPLWPFLWLTQMDSSVGFIAF